MKRFIRRRAVVGAHVRIYLPSILLTHPWLTLSWREMSQGRTPWWASSTIRCRTTSGRGLPFTNTPPSWFTPPCPGRVRENIVWGQSKEEVRDRKMLNIKRLVSLNISDFIDLSNKKKVSTNEENLMRNFFFSLIFRKTPQDVGRKQSDMFHNRRLCSQYDHN